MAMENGPFTTKKMPIKLEMFTSYLSLPKLNSGIVDDGGCPWTT